MVVSVRKAVLEDLETLADLFDQYRQFYGQVSNIGLSRDFIRERMIRQESIILLAETEPGDAGGFCQLYPSFSSVSAARIYILNDLYVAPFFRRAGLARALLTAACSEAAALGAVRLALATALDNLNAQALYESSGWVRDARFYHYNYSLT